jgi:hypothetical protein
MGTLIPSRAALGKLASKSWPRQATVTLNYQTCTMEKRNVFRHCGYFLKANFHIYKQMFPLKWVNLKRLLNS